MTQAVAGKRVMNTLKKWFLPWVYWRDRFTDLAAETYHPEFGTFWGPKNSGGLYLMQAQDVGYKLGYETATRDHMKILVQTSGRAINVKRDCEFRVFILNGMDTEAMKIRACLEAFYVDGWEVVGMYRQETKDDGFNRIIIGPNPQDTVTMYFKRCKGSPSTR